MQFTKERWPILESIRQVSEVRCHVTHSLRDPDAVPGRSVQGMLQDGEESLGAWQGWQYGAQLPQQFVPEGYGRTFAGEIEMAKKVVQTLESMLRQLDGASMSVEIPAEDSFLCAPACISIAVDGIPPFQGAKHVINSGEGVPEDVMLLGLRLGHEQEVIDIDVNTGYRGPTALRPLPIAIGLPYLAFLNDIDRGRCGDGLQPMHRAAGSLVGRVAAQAVVGKVPNCLDERTKIGWGFHRMGNANAMSCGAPEDVGKTTPNLGMS